MLYSNHIIIPYNISYVQLSLKSIFIFYVIFTHRLIKISSPKLNYFIIAGAMLMYASIYFYLLPVTRIAVVQARCIVSLITLH